MRITINDNNEITGYAIVGGFEGDFEVSDEIIPSGFIDNYRPKYYIYSNDVISVNPNYQPEEFTFDSVKEQQPQTSYTDEMIKLMISTLQKQSVQSNRKMVQLENDNADLKARIFELENILQSEGVETYDE